MSDLLSRMAQRAVGESPAARPRLPTRFEEAAATVAATLETIDEEVVAARPMLARDAAPPGRSRAPAAPGQASIQRVGEAAPTTGEAEAARPTPRPDETATLPAITVVEQTERRPEPLEIEPPEPRPATAVSSEDPRAAVVAALPATSLVPAVAAAHEPTPPAPPAVAHDEPPTVRVHIGRLEVRANLQQAASPQLSDAPRAEGLSLADYLRGKREPA